MNILKTGLAAYRITKLVIDDEITRELREKIMERIEGNEKLEYLATCPWCISIYAGVAVVVIEKAVPELNTVLASSAITGLVYSNLG